MEEIKNILKNEEFEIWEDYFKQKELFEQNKKSFLENKTQETLKATNEQAIELMEKAKKVLEIIQVYSTTNMQIWVKLWGIWTEEMKWHMTIHDGLELK
ncbi:hypothetical protein M0811_02428 [Anaeramoeba ignava]|uniref:Uncharacterized protein n=1 Tax=Anaeramoeba ignava TaxID=1746090 RepID=A0A9Q0LC07_ANAIG|nr:hypothetical protein M0811_02428 [Anaeramoeba ignava]